MSTGLGVTLIVVLLALGALLAARAGIRSMQSARKVAFFRTRRAHVLAGWQWLILALVLFSSSVASALFAEPVANQLFPPSPTPTVSPTGTPLPTATLPPSQTNTSTLTATLTPEGTLTPTPTASPTPTFTPTWTLTPSLTPTQTASVTSSPTPIPTNTGTPTSSRTPVPTSTSVPTRTPRPTWTPSPTRTPRPTLTFTITATHTLTSTITQTPTPTRTALPTSTVRPSDTPRPTSTRQPTNTITLTPTIMNTPTATSFPTQTFTATNTSTPTATRTPRPTHTPEPTQTPRPTLTFTRTPTNTLTPTASITSTITPIPTNTLTFTPTRTPLPTSTVRPSNTPRPTSTRQPTNTSTLTSTITNTVLPTPTNTLTPTASFTPTLTLSPSNTVTQIPSRTPTVTLTPSATVTLTPSDTPSRTPTVTPSRTRTPTPTPTPNRGCDRIELVAHLTVPDNSVFTPGSSFTKVWRLRNSGTCTWKTNYRVILVSGDAMGGQTIMPLPGEVLPGQTIDLAMKFTAPLIEGSYRGNWQIRNDKGEIFGTTSTANRPFSVAIRVRTPASTATRYDFVTNVCSAQWFSGAGNLNCPSSNNDRNGFVLRQNTASLEDRTIVTRPSLLTAPQNTFNGYIRGLYPSYRVQHGDHFQAIVNCEGNATSCRVLFRLDYQLADGLVRELWASGEENDGAYSTIDLDLSSLAGQDVRFILSVLSLGPASGDRALWVEPRIARSDTGAVLPTPTP